MRQTAGIVVLVMIVTVLGGAYFTLRAQEAAQPEKTEVKASDVLSAQQAEKHNWTKTIFGVGMWPLWLCSVLLITLIFERRKALKPDKIMDGSMVESVINNLSEGKVAEAREAAANSDTVVGQAWAQGFHEYQLGGVTLYEGLTNSTLLAFKPLKRNLQAIQTLAVISPLFGLLGTVIGMIITFSQIAATGGADKTELAGGIGLALFTTAGGLIIAIPAIVANRYFSTRITSLAEQAESGINRANYRHTHARAEARKAAKKDKQG